MIFEHQLRCIDNYSEMAAVVRAAAEQLQSKIQRMAEIVTKAHQDCQNEVQLLLSEFGNKADDEEDDL